LRNIGKIKSSIVRLLYNASDYLRNRKYLFHVNYNFPCAMKMDSRRRNGKHFANKKLRHTYFCTTH